MSDKPKKIKDKNKQQYPFNNRELSWMDFNYRVLEEAQKKENPILERVKFLSITASNLDEFFMVRVAGLMDQVHSGYNKQDPSGMTPSEQLDKLIEKTHIFMERQYSCLSRSIIPTLKKNNLFFLKYEELSNELKKKCDNYFDKVLFPVLTPLAVDTSRPFPLLANKSLNIAVRLTKDDSDAFAVVQVPSIIPRFFEVSKENGRSFILIEEIIKNNLNKLFELYKIETYTDFRLTRDSDLDIDEESEDLMVAIEKSIKKRQRGEPVRVEIAQKCDKNLLDFLVDMLKIDKSEIYEICGPLDLTFLSKFGSLDGCDDLRFEPIKPVASADFYGYDNVFEAIREKDRMVHHPYESFDSVIKFVQAAAEDENVLAIKQTLYRVSGNSPIVAALIRAAENGKQVTVLVELKARFDEENNIVWAKKLEKAGCHVIYGLQGLKTHCKILLVVRREEDGIRRYLHLGTGNYNDITARFYTDIGMFTCHESFGRDASSLFNVITGYSAPPEYLKMNVAPLGLRSFFETMVQREISNANNGFISGITIKVNSMVDPELISLLYDASRAGVKITLIVRGICCLIPEIEGVSENITVISIVGQLLEHSRIFKFENAGNPVVYIGSADWMQRNLDKRVELVFPVEDEDLKKRVFSMLDIMMNDTTNARIQHSDMTYVSVDKRGKQQLTSQLEFYRLAKESLKAVKNDNEKKIFVPKEGDK